MSGSSAPARAMCRCARRNRSADELDDLKGACDLVLIDAPCTGTGAWRRNPDAKWRMRPGALEQRHKEQAEVLDRAAPLLKAGGRIAYVTCSVLEEENGAPGTRFPRPPCRSFPCEPPARSRRRWASALSVQQGGALSEEGLLMTPRTTDTDRLLRLRRRATRHLSGIPRLRRIPGQISPR